MSPKIEHRAPVLFPPQVGGPAAPQEKMSLSMRTQPEPAAERTPARRADADVYDTTRATTFDAAPGLQHTDGRLSPKASHGQLPSDLKSKISEKVWMALPEGQRSTLLASYQQFKRAGVWDQVTQVLGEKEKREAPTALPGGHEADVAGNSGAIQYRIADPKAFVKKLTASNPEFGVDGGVMGALHAGQISIRQAGPPTSLHISVGPGNLMDAHIDRHNPVDHPQRGQTQMNVLGGIRHWSREVLPEMIRKNGGNGGPAGVIIDPQLKGGRRTEPGGAGPEWSPNGGERGEGKIMVSVELNGIRKRKPTVEKAPMEGSPSVPDGVMEKVNARLDQVKIVFPVPAGVDKSEAPLPRAVAAALAAKIKEAVEKGERNVQLDLGNTYAGLPGMQQQLLGEVGKLGKLVRAELERAGVDVSGVTSLTVSMGHVAGKRATQGGTVSLE